MSPDAEEAHLRQLVDEVVRLLPGGWKDARLAYRAVGDHEVIRLLGTEEGSPSHYPYGIRRAGRLVPHTRIPELLRRHRELTYHPDHGTWLSLTYKLWNRPAGVDWGVTPDLPERFRWTDEITPADAAAELARYPRPDKAVPGWLRDLAALHAIGRSFDPRTLLARPQRESDLTELLPPGLEELFLQARMRLADLVPGPDRLRVGSLEDGCRTIARTSGAWLAIGPGQAVQPFGDARAATVQAVAGVLADAGLEINSAVLEAARMIERRARPDIGQDAWLVPAEPGGLLDRTSDGPRPARPGPFIALDPLHNRPGGHFVCRPGPAPEYGSFVSAGEVYRAFTDWFLPTPLPDDEPEPAPEPPGEVLRGGAEVDTYHGPADHFVFDVGTPYLRRGMNNTATPLAYRVYRVHEPIRGRTGLFATGPIGDAAPPGNTGAGYYLTDPIADLVASGHLVEITGPGGEPGPTVQPPEEQP